MQADEKREEADELLHGEAEEGMEALARMSHAIKCRQCGKCCRPNGEACRFLNAQNRCEIYADRFELNPDCLDLEGAIAHGALPDDCPYMEGIERSADNE